MLYILKLTLSMNMAGSEMIMEFNDVNIQSILRSCIIERIYILLERIYILLERYENSASNINDIIITFIPVNTSFVNKFKVHVATYSGLSKFISFLNKTILPISITSDYVAEQLEKDVFNGKISNVKFNINSFFYISVKHYLRLISVSTYQVYIY